MYLFILMVTKVFRQLVVSTEDCAIFGAKFRWHQLRPSVLRSDLLSLSAAVEAEFVAQVGEDGIPRASRCC